MASSPAQGPQSPFYVRYARKIAIGLVGGVVVVAGVVLSLPGIPGPGLLVVFLGLGILSLEFAWAERARRDLRRRFDRAVARARSRRRKQPRVDARP